MVLLEKQRNYVLGILIVKLLQTNKETSLMATRQAILIGAAKVKPELPGVIVDIKDIKNFLLSNLGGAWKETEIVTLIDQPTADINKALDIAKYKDYVFITCSGHGEHQIGKGLDETVMYLNEKETMSISSINPKNKRHFVVVDVCRHIVKIEKETRRAVMDAFMESAKKSFIDYRKIFDDAIMANSEGRIVGYSCDINQSAGDDGSGGVFTQELLNAPRNFTPSNNSPYGIVRIDKAFERAKEMTYKKNAPQSPVFNAGRRQDYFPFAIV